MPDQANPVLLRDRAVRFFRKEIVPFLAVVVVLMTMRSSLADWYDVPTGSMRPTILEGDRILVNKLAYDLRVPFLGWRIMTWNDPARGEIVIFPSPKDGTRLVKRVVGLPGDAVELRDNVLFINDQPSTYSPIDPATLEQVPSSERPGRIFATELLAPATPHALTITPGTPAPRSFPRLIVPPDHYLMLGDNRDQSGDSRSFGFVPRGSIVGRSSRIALSLDYAKWWPRWTRTGRALE